MAKHLEIESTPLQILEFNGMRVVTLPMVDAAHQRPERTARRNFDANKDKLIEGEDYFVIGAHEFRARLDPSLSKFANEDMVLLTESGYLLLVKSFTDDLAWKVQRRLVNAYFKANMERITSAQKQHLKELVHIVVASGKQTYGETWARFQRKFHVERYRELPQSEFDTAVAYLKGKMDTESLAALVKKHFPQQFALDFERNPEEL